jgi:voltage-gated potassium channel Kch
MSSPKKSAKVQPVEDTKSQTTVVDGIELSGSIHDENGDGKIDRSDLDLRDRETPRARVRIFCEEPESSQFATIFHTAFSVMIILSIICYMTSSLNDGGKADPKNLSPDAYKGIEIVFTTMFTIDLGIRFLVADTYLKPRKHMRKHEEPHAPFFFDILNLFDLLSVMPLPIEMIFASSPEMEDMVSTADLKLLGVFRVIRVFKIARHFDGTKVLFTTMSRSAKPLLISVFMLIAGCTIITALLFFFEPCYSTECVLKDCYNTGYYIAVTLTTVGYGDQIPTTIMGRGIGVFVMVLGSFYMAMPLAVIGSRFEEAFQEREKEKAALSEEYEKLVLKSLQGVTRRQRRERVCRLGYQVAESLGELEEVKNDMGDLDETGIKEQLHQRLLQITMDLRVLFRLEAPIKSSNSASKDGGEEKGDVDSFWDADLYTGDDSNLDEIGHDKLEDIHMATTKFFNQIKEAHDRNTWRDRLWLLLDVQDSSPSAYYLHNLRLIITGLSIMVCFAETMPEANYYNEDARLCKQVVGYYCMKVPDTPASRLLNPGCFPSQNTSFIDGYRFDYKGCEVTGSSQTASCHFPAPNIGLTCYKPERPVVANMSNTDKSNFVKQWLGNSVLHGKTIPDQFTNTLLYESDAAYESRPWNAPFDPNLEHISDTQIETVYPICNRVQCANLGYSDYSSMFMYLETFFTTFFVCELLLRVLTIRNCKEWMKDKANLVDVVAITTTFFEVVYIPYSWGEFRYEVWGNTDFFDPATFRALRILVSIRFITMQRHFSGVQVIVKTVQLVKGKMAIPLFFLFIFVTLFASLFNFFERGSLYDCPTFDSDNMDSIPEEKCVKCKSYTHDLYDGTCQLMHSLGTGSGPAELFPVMVSSVFDAWWTMIVTMTTVGYGGKYPRRAAGKVIAISAAMIGSFYLAMPLTIIGTQFYDVYQQIEEEEIEDLANRREVFREKTQEEESIERAESSGHLNLNAMVKLKAMVQKRKRMKKENITDEERNMLEAYVTQAGAVRRGNIEVDAFLRVHYKVMMLISRKFYRDFDSGGPAMLDNRH